MENGKSNRLSNILNKTNRNGAGFNSIEEALEAEELKLTLANKQIERLSSLVEKMKIGCQIKLNEKGQPEKAIVTKIKYPDATKEYSATDYQFEYRFPGDTPTTVRKYTFHSLLENKHFNLPDDEFRIFDGLNSQNEGLPVLELIDDFNESQGTNFTHEDVLGFMTLEEDDLDRDQKDILAAVKDNQMTLDGILSEFDLSESISKQKTIEILTGNVFRAMN